MDRVQRYLKDLESSSALVRKFAARYLRDCPDPRALPALLQALQDAEPEVRKEAVETLGAVGDESVRPALARAVRDADGGVTVAARAALEALDARRGSPRRPAPPAGETAPAGRDALLRSALGGLEAEVKDRSYGYRVALRLIGGRTQVVRIVFDRSDPDGDAIVLVLTVCGPAEPRVFPWALRTNNKLPYGALAVRDWKGKEMLVLRETFLESDLTADALRKTVLLLAEKGDWIEAQLTRADLF